MGNLQIRDLSQSFPRDDGSQLIVLDHLNLVARPPLSLTELDDVLKRMTADHQIKDVTGGDEIRKIGITDEGQAARM